MSSLTRSAWFEADDLVVHRAVAAGGRLQLVVHVVDDLAQRQVIDELGAVGADVLGRLVLAAPFGAHLHDDADVVCWHDERHSCDWFADLLDVARFGDVDRIIDVEHLTRVAFLRLRR